jgi:predicted metalloprotease
MWEKVLLQQTGQQYRRAKLVLFRDYTQSGCGVAKSQTGPFYCPADEKVYIDLGFWDELRKIGGSTGEFAQAYVIAHELGHHVQNILGIERQMRQLSSRNPGQQNALSVRLELQADCLAGVWGHSAAQRGKIDQADVNDGLSAAAAVGDDHIQKMSRGAVSPESFTHGSSAQRQSWFTRGLQQGDVNACNTFQNSSSGSF